MLHKCPQLASRRRVVIDSAATCVRNWGCQCWWPLTQQLHSSLVRLILFSHNLSFRQNVSKINYSIICHIRTNVATGWSGYRKILIARIAKLDVHFRRYRCSNNTLKYFNNYKTLPLTDFPERVVDRVQVCPLSWEELGCIKLYCTFSPSSISLRPTTCYKLYQSPIQTVLHSSQLFSRTGLIWLQLEAIFLPSVKLSCTRISLNPLSAKRF